MTVVLLRMTLLALRTSATSEVGSDLVDKYGSCSYVWMMLVTYHFVPLSFLAYLALWQAALRCRSQVCNCDFSFVRTALRHPVESFAASTVQYHRLRDETLVVHCTVGLWLPSWEHSASTLFVPKIVSANHTYPAPPSVTVTSGCEPVPPGRLPPTAELPFHPSKLRFWPAAALPTANSIRPVSTTGTATIPTAIPGGSV